MCKTEGWLVDEAAKRRGSSRTNETPPTPKRGSAIGLQLVVVVVSFAVLAAGCATTDVPYKEGARARSSGEINILMSRAAPQVSVLVDDKILVDARFWGTRRVNVQGVPEGEHHVKVFANSWQLKGPVDYETTVQVKANGNVPVTVQVPNYSTLYWVYIIGIGIVSALPTIIVVTY